MQDSGYRYLFGPVLSRRIGRSLGIDLVPSKICSFDCPYCQIGRTVERTLERREYVPTADVLAELDDWLARGGEADCVTLAGSGEPTLHTRFGDVLAGIRSRTPCRTALLSNGSLFSLAEVRAAACRADIVKGTLSAWDEASFRAIHRPHPGLDFERFLGGLRSLRAAFAGEFWVEVFLVPGVNDRRDDVARIAALVNGLRADRVHLNTAVRPPADAGVAAVAADALERLAGLFVPAAETAAVRPPGKAPGGGEAGGSDDDRIVAMVGRHPCTGAEIAAALGLGLGEAERRLDALAAGGRVRRKGAGPAAFYTAAG
jgi:wyosine [tRNA(Phe)-imidazoG37] synthetase (radical SAM superfamily)